MSTQTEDGIPNSSNDLFKIPCMAMVAIKHVYLDVIKEIIFSKIETDSNYIIACETSLTTHKETNGEHIHLLIDATDLTWKQIREKITYRFPNLRSKAEKGKPRQIGKVKNIKDIETSTIYTLKENKYISNIDPEILLEYYRKSFMKKDPKKEIYDEWLDYMNDIIYPIEERPKEVTLVGDYDVEYMEFINACKRRTIDFYVDNKYKLPTKTSYNCMILNFIAQYAKHDMKHNKKMLIRLYS